MFLTNGTSVKKRNYCQHDDNYLDFGLTSKKINEAALKCLYPITLFVEKYKVSRMRPTIINWNNLEVKFGLNNNKDTYLLCPIQFILSNILKKDFLFCRKKISKENSYTFYTFISEDILNWRKFIVVFINVWWLWRITGSYSKPIIKWTMKALRYLYKSVCVKASESSIESGAGKLGECDKFYQISSKSRIFFRTCVRIWKYSSLLFSSSFW